MQELIEKLWESRENLRNYVGELEAIFVKLDKGELRVAEKIGGQWKTNEWIKKAILLYFMTHDNQVIGTDHKSYDKIPLKFSNYTKEDFDQGGFRIVPSAVVRQSAYIAPKVILMPSFVNVGSYIDSGTLIDTWATVGSCAQIGKNCHISGGVGIGGVLEPIQASPVIIEDNVFIGARSEVAEGVIVEEGAVLSMGVYIGASTRIYNRQTGETFFGKVPAYSVVVPGTIPSSDGKTQTYAAIIVKQVDAKTREKTGINELLRAS
jgi:2,3,4,5-tetrahydropyridine-2,6-dicarboxylate N-succinyltransferase